MGEKGYIVTKEEEGWYMSETAASAALDLDSELF